jgi:hypothetical protein
LESSDLVGIGKCPPRTSVSEEWEWFEAALAALQMNALKLLDLQLFSSSYALGNDWGEVIDEHRRCFWMEFQVYYRQQQFQLEWRHLSLEKNLSQMTCLLVGQ